MRTQNARRSRLYKKLEEKSKKNLLLTVFAIILITASVIKFGVPMMVNFALFISGSKDYDQNIKHEDSSFISPPFLNPLPIATNSAEVIIGGVSAPNQTIMLYINDNLVNTAETQKNGNFSFIETLTKAENVIKVKAKANGKESEFSALNIAYINTPPSLTVASPTSDQSFSKDQNTVEIRGETDALTKVTVNDFWAITDQSNHFSYVLTLKEGENLIKVVATDRAGNKTEKEIRVTYSP